jgi:hypothetical protein
MNVTRHDMKALAVFNDAALAAVQSELDRLGTELTFTQARALPEAQAKDIVVAGKEVQLTIYRQTELGFLNGGVLLTVQLARFGLGGVVAQKIERGLVFSAGAAPRDATEGEILESVT